MKESVNTYDLYLPLPEHTIIEFIPGSADNLIPCHKVVLKQLNTGEITTVEVSYCAILIGFRPDLHFLDPITKQDGIKTTEYENYFIKDSQLLTSPYNLLSRKIAWLKNLCAKCKHLSICEKNRKHNIMQRQPLNRLILCSCTSDSQYKQNNKTHSDNNNNINSINTNCDSHYLNCKDGQIEKKTPTTVKVSEPKTLVPLGLGEDQTKPVDCKSNPIDVDKYTNEVLSVASKGLYAMGPLVSDNFIRFIPGGALAITSALWRNR